MIAFQAWVAALWVLCLHSAARRLGCTRLDAALVGGMGLSTAAFAFWFAVPETYPLGSLTILAGVLFALSLSRRQAPLWQHIAVGLCTLSMSVTNWMFSLLATVASLPLRRTLKVFALTLAAGIALSLLQRALFPGAGLFFFGSGEESAYLFPRRPGGVLGAIRVLLVDSAAIGNPVAQPGRTPFWPAMTVQAGMPGSASPTGILAVACWVALLGFGLYRVVRLPGQRALKCVVLGGLLAQIGLHAMYGNESFLYGLHLVPLCLVAIAAGLVGARSVVWRGLAAGFIVFGAINTQAAFERVTDIARDSGTARDEIRREVARRPADFWPTSLSHAVLAVPGSADHDKLYVEPGGSFSPWVGSFGVSVAVVGADGAIRVTSDTIDARTMQNAFVTSGTTGAMAATFSAPQRYRLELTVQDEARVTATIQASGQLRAESQSVWVLIRGVGPAAGPVKRIELRDGALVINDRWMVRGFARGARVVLGDEGARGLALATTEPASARQISERGWAYAAIRLDDPATVLDIVDTASPVIAAHRQIETPVALDWNLPDEWFSAGAAAQMRHLLAGLVGDRTRPGEPIHYGQEWLRDGAYVVVALARAGHVDLAKRLAAQLASTDFSGGFGAEADAPGLALWALGEVDALARDPAWTAAIWPHVKRKMDWIARCATATAAIRQPVTWPLIPRFGIASDADFVCDRARDGLIIGKMDLQRPILFVTAISFAGTREASAIARRSGNVARADEWDGLARSLQQAWHAEFERSPDAVRKRMLSSIPVELSTLLHAPSKRAVLALGRYAVARPKESLNPRTYIAPLWPADIAAGMETLLSTRLNDRWNGTRDERGAFRGNPLWTYFDLAETHQWLRLGDVEKVWRTLEWFRDHDPMRGLYNLWEDRGEGNNTFRWEGIRGWTAPPTITPHYWAAAEMLLLQLEMLAYVEDRGVAPTLVLGAGVPASWLGRSFSVRGMQTRLGTVNYAWDGKGEMTVTVNGPMPAIRLGRAFPASARVRVQSP